MCLRSFKNISRRLGSVLCLVPFGIGLCALFSVFLAACATTEEVGMMQYDIIRLENDVKALKKKSRIMEAQLPSHQGQLNKKLQGQSKKLHELEESQKATAKAVSDLLIKIQELSADVQRITGRLEETQYFSEEISKELTENKDLLITQKKELTKNKDMLIAQTKEWGVVLDDLKKRLTQLERSYAFIEKEGQKKFKEAEKVKKTGEFEEGVKTPGIDVKDVYMAGYEAYKAGRSKEAREKFKSVLEDYPENEYSDNARFWIGESYYRDGNYEDAILAYEELFRKNPDSGKVPGAMLKQGLAFYGLNDKKTGKIILEKLIERFPDTKQAKIAKEKIKELTSAKRKK